MAIIDQLPNIKAVVCWLIKEVPQKYAKDGRVYTWSEFMKKGADISDSELE